MNASGLNSRDITGLDRDNAALFGPQLAQTLNNLISRQIRLGFLGRTSARHVEQRHAVGSIHHRRTGLAAPADQLPHL